MLQMGHMIPVPLQANWRMRQTLMMLLPNMEKTTPTPSMKTTCLPLKVQQMVGFLICTLGKVNNFRTGISVPPLLWCGTYVLYRFKWCGFFLHLSTSLLFTYICYISSTVSLEVFKCWCILGEKNLNIGHCDLSMESYGSVFTEIVTISYHIKEEKVFTIVYLGHVLKFKNVLLWVCWHNDPSWICRSRQAYMYYVLKWCSLLVFFNALFNDCMLQVLWGL